MVELLVVQGTVELLLEDVVLVVHGADEVDDDDGSRRLAQTPAANARRTRPAFMMAVERCCC